jgi:cellulose synthase/poly-beta-1,6-N-acetylglucosamine synthase-like glycosyltransferase
MYHYIFFGIIIIFCIYLIYKKYNNRQKKELESLQEAIKNQITITIYNINKFIDISIDTKKMLIPYAYKYKHEDVIKLLNNKN